MPRHLPTGSKVERWLECPASTQLPQVTEETLPAINGTGGHRYLEVLALHGREAANKTYDSWEDKTQLERFKSVAIEDLPIAEGHMYEAAFQYWVETGEAALLGCGLQRAYPAPDEDSVVMSLDVVSLDKRGVVHVWDYKTGKKEYDGPVSGHPQLLMGALAACTFFAVEDAVISLVYIKDDGRVHTVSAEVDIFALETFADRLRKARRKAAIIKQQIAKGWVPDVRMGRWCHYCTAVEACPGQRSVALEVFKGNDAAPFNRSLSRQAMGEAWEKLKLIKGMCNKIERQIIAEAGREPITLPSGKTLGVTQAKKREKLDGVMTHDVISEMFGPEVANLACDFTVTKKGIEDALKNHLPKGQSVRKSKLAVIDEVRARGGIPEVWEKKVKEY